MSRTSESPRRGNPPALHHDYPLMLLAPPALHDLFDSYDFQAQIKTSTHLDSIHLDTRLPDTPHRSRVLHLRSANLADTFEALSLVMREMSRVGEGREVSIFIPEDMVSPFIGTKGRGVFALQDQTSTKIQVEKPVEGMRDRQVRINGAEDDVHNAVQILYRKVVERRHPIDFIPGNTIKFAIPQTCAAHLIGKGGSFTKALQKDFGVELKVSADSSCKEKELSAILIGKKSRCLEALDEVIKKMEEAIYNSDAPKNASRTVMLLRTQASDATIDSLVRAVKKEQDVSVKLYSPINGEFRIEISGDLRRRQKATRMLIDALDSSRHRHSPRRRSRSRSRSLSPARTTINVAVPRSLVGRLIGKSGENVKMLKGKSGCHINFQQQNLKDVKTADGQEARVCTMTGPANAIAQGVRLLWEQILKFETMA